MLASLKLAVGVYYWIVLLWAISTWLPEDFQRSIRPVLDPIVEPPVNAISSALPDGFQPFSVLALLIGLHALQRLI
jgi:uncharacterized protein YggT (Ycf19 family)